jgi:peptidoglycan biosynthesis protein MviN/MurJ (putative lipid II flippase)
LRLEIIKKILIASTIALTYRWGIEAMVIGQVATSILSYYVNAYFNRTIFDYSIWKQIGDFYPYMVASLIMAAAVYSLTFTPVDNSLLMLTCQVALGGLIYLIICKIFRFSALTELLRMIAARRHSIAN